MFVYCVLGLACVNLSSKITSLHLKLPFKDIIERLILGLNQETVQFMGGVELETRYLHMYEFQPNMLMLNLLSPSSDLQSHKFSRLSSLHFLKELFERTSW